MDIRSPQIVGARSGRTPRYLAGEVALMILRTMLWIGFTALGTALNMWGAVVLLLLITPGNFWGYLGTILGAAVIGCVGGMIIGFGQVLALRRWLDGAASLGSFFSTVLASSSSLAAGTAAGWWVHTVAGDLIGALAGLVIYGCVFGFIQRPMVDYMARHSLLWVPVNAAASVLGAMGMLAAFDVSGGRRDMLQFRYAGVAYALVAGAAFIWMTRWTRRAMADRRTVNGDTTTPYTHYTRDSAPVQTVRGGRGIANQPGDDVSNAGFVTGVLEVHEHRIYRVYSAYRSPGDHDAGHGGYSDTPGNRSEDGDISESTKKSGVRLQRQNRRLYAFDGVLLSERVYL